MEKCSLFIEDRGEGEGLAGALKHSHVQSTVGALLSLADGMPLSQNDNNYQQAHMHYDTVTCGTYNQSYAQYCTISTSKVTQTCSQHCRNLVAHSAVATRQALAATHTQCPEIQGSGARTGKISLLQQNTIEIIWNEMRKNRIDEHALHAEPRGTAKTILVQNSVMVGISSSKNRIQDIAKLHLYRSHVRLSGYGQIV